MKISTSLYSTCLIFICSKVGCSLSSSMSFQDGPSVPLADSTSPIDETSAALSMSSAQLSSKKLSDSRSTSSISKSMKDPLFLAEGSWETPTSSFKISVKDSSLLSSLIVSQNSDSMLI